VRTVVSEFARRIVVDKDARLEYLARGTAVPLAVVCQSLNGFGGVHDSIEGALNVAEELLSKRSNRAGSVTKTKMLTPETRSATRAYTTRNPLISQKYIACCH
jgi:hypothetical protein